MSGAQAKASVITGCVGVIAEISEEALVKRHKQGWLDVYSNDLDKVIELIREYRAKKSPVSIGYLGNVVDLWWDLRRLTTTLIQIFRERLAEEEDVLVELGSDQTSCHNPFNGGYYPVGLSFEEANQLMATDKPRFEKLVQERLVIHRKGLYPSLSV